MRKPIFACIAVVMVGLVMVGCSDDGDKEGVVPHETLNKFSGEQDFEFSLSHGGATEFASFFTVDEKMHITNILWSGVLDTLGAGEHGIIGDTAIFKILIFPNTGDGDVGESPLFESLVLARVYPQEGDFSGHHLLDINGGYILSFRPHPGILLYPGEYWMSITDADLPNFFFYWAVERGMAGLDEGSGGARRWGAGTSWSSTSSGIEAVSATGLSLRIEGTKD